jgi:capsular polysaccharide biosynthesis protein
MIGSAPWKLDANRIAIANGAARAPLYESHAKVFVSLQSTASVQDLVLGNTFTEQAVQGYAQVAVTPIVLGAVRDKLGLKTSSSELANRIDASAPLQSNVLTISVRDESPAGAMAIANAVSARLSDVAPRVAATACRPARNKVSS